MAPVGPQLPPSTTGKRRREDDGDVEDSTSGSDSEPGPAPPTLPTEVAPKKARVIGPSLPPPTQDPESKPDLDVEKSSESSDDDDDFGPSLPPLNSDTSSTNKSSTEASSQPSAASQPPVVTKRDDWMIVPPSGGDWTARVDPTKIKNRKFNTGKGAKGPSSSGGGATGAWHETPQEKQARLQREMMGSEAASTRSTSHTQPTLDKADLETAKRLQEYNKARGPTLYEAHQKSQTTEQDDDPSARAFDREKDIGGGLQINATQRRDMMKKASDFSSRFSSAKYL